MSKAIINGIQLYYETRGEGAPLVFCHEFAGDHRSWKDQVEFFSRRYRVLIYNARGYPPSDVPASLSLYSQEQSVEDLLGLLEYLGIEQAHVSGLSMGGNVALHFGLAYPQRVRSLIVAGIGTGSADPELFRQRIGEFAHGLETRGMPSLADYPRGPQRVQLLRKDPERWQEFHDQFLEHSPVGMALTLRGVLRRRPPVFALGDKLLTLDTPMLILVGDEDDPCLEPSLFLKRHIARSGLVVFPQTGHTLNLEEPDRFNQTVLEFLKAVEAGSWAKRDAGVATAALVSG